MKKEAISRANKEKKKKGSVWVGEMCRDLALAPPWKGRLCACVCKEWEE